MLFLTLVGEFPHPGLADCLYGHREQGFKSVFYSPRVVCGMGVLEDCRQARGDNLICLYGSLFYHKKSWRSSRCVEKSKPTPLKILFITIRCLISCQNLYSDKKVVLHQDLCRGDSASSEHFKAHILNEF